MGYQANKRSNDKINDFHDNQLQILSNKVTMILCDGNFIFLSEHSK